MNFRRLVPGLQGILLGAVLFFPADVVDAQPLAFRYNLIQKFIVANRFIFGAGINKSFLYAYEPSALRIAGVQSLCGNTPCDWRILTPTSPTRWWASTPYNATPPEDYVRTGNGRCQYREGVVTLESILRCIEEGALVAADTESDGVRLSDIFVLDSPAINAREILSSGGRRRPASVVTPSNADNALGRRVPL